MAPGAVDRIAPRSTISQRHPVFADPRPGGGSLQHAMPRVTGCESTPDDSVLCTDAAAPEAARRAGARLIPRSADHDSWGSRRRLVGQEERCRRCGASSKLSDALRRAAYATATAACQGFRTASRTLCDAPHRLGAHLGPKILVSRLVGSWSALLRITPVIALPGLAATAEPATRRGCQAAADSGVKFTQILYK